MAQMKVEFFDVYAIDNPGLTIISPLHNRPQPGGKAESSSLLPSLPNATLALIILFTFLSVLIALERLLPKYKKLSTACELWPLAVMYGTWLGLPGADIDVWFLARLSQH
jgi:hypothetical protein